MEDKKSMPVLKAVIDEQEVDTQEIEFEICIPETEDKRLALLNEGISEIDELLAENGEKLDKLNTEIDRLTNKADAIDYAIAVASGVLTGLIDAFFVGETEIDKNKIQKLLEKKYHTANDSAYLAKNKSGNAISSPMYHRLDDLAHHPSLLGLVASILVRYLRLVVYIDGSDGKPHIFFANKSGNEAIMKLEKEQLIKAWIGAVIAGVFIWLANIAEKKCSEKYDEEMPEPLRKLVKVISTTPLFIEILKSADSWIGHIMSDVSTPQGIPGMFLSFLKEISVLPILRDSNLPVFVDGLYNKGGLNLPKWEGVVFVAAKKQAIPVIINEVLVRGFYFVRRLLAEYKKNSNFTGIAWEDVIPFKNRTIVRMMTIASSTFTAVDIADAAIRAGGFNAACLLRVNFVGVGRCVVAIGTDIGMGIKKSKLEKERMLVHAERLHLLNAKIFYKQGEMWIAAESTEKALEEAEKMLEQTIIFYNESIKEMDDNFEKIDEHLSGGKIDENNPDLTDDILKILDPY